MAKTVELKASARDRAGKGAARAVRRQGRVPGVIYGDKKEPRLIAMDYLPLWKHVETGRFLSTLVDLEVDGETIRTLPRDVQFHPVTDTVIHVDFLRLGAGARIAVEVPVHFVNELASPGIKRGGVLNVVRHEVEIMCPADNIPEVFDVDLTGWDIGDSIHASHLKLPEGTAYTITDRDFTIATIAAPSSGVSEAAPAAAAEAAPAEEKKA